MRRPLPRHAEQVLATLPGEGWMARASCRDLDPEHFDHPSPTSARVCPVCPVAARCAAAGMYPEQQRPERLSPDEVRERRRVRSARARARTREEAAAAALRFRRHA